MSFNLDFWQFVMTSQRERKKMTEGKDNIESHLSCDNFLYDECNLEVSDSGNGVQSGSEDKKYSSGSMDMLGKELYQFEPTGTKDDFATLHPALTSAQDDPLQHALVLIRMHTMWWWYIVCSGDFIWCGRGSCYIQ